VVARGISGFGLAVSLEQVWARVAWELRDSLTAVIPGQEQFGVLGHLVNEAAQPKQRGHRVPIGWDPVAVPFNRLYGNVPATAGGVAKIPPGTSL
jgi:hypothetical protein